MSCGGLKKLIELSASRKILTNMGRSQKSKFKKGKGPRNLGVFGAYIDLLAKFVPKDRRRPLLDSNAPLSQYMKNENEVLRKLAESMTHGVLGPCPECKSWNLKHQFKTGEFRCLGDKDATDVCKYLSPDPPRCPFTVPADYHDIEFLKNYNFEERENLVKEYNQGLQEEQEKEREESKEWKDKRQGYTMSDKTNEMFERYYKEQGLIPEAEWDKFLEVHRSPLPATFRVTGYKAQSMGLLDVLKNDYFCEISEVVIDDKKIDPPKCLTWYPGGLAWQLNLERTVIRHNEALGRLKRFLVTETESGHISRQEAVSMIPPLVLDVKPHHKVLDLCAAPGSKTAQLVEALHADGQAIPEGFVVANDRDNKRCYLMVHQVKRLESPCYAIINHDASQMPGIWTETEGASKLLKFDRVLADVPCTGDGTFRKNVDAWAKWNSAAAHNLHPVQCRILKRGLDVLEEGGKLVYSTCSLNPVEDEAVLASVLTNYEGSAELMDVSGQLPGLLCSPGVATWRVMARTGEWFDKLDEVPEKLRTQIYQSTFPPTPEAAEKLHLERCMRVLPHQQDTGGFFIAVIKKTEHPKTRLRRLKEETATGQIDDAEGSTENGASIKEKGDDPAVESVGGDAEKDDGKRRDKRHISDPDNPPPLKKQKLRGFKEDPFVFLTKDYESWTSIKEFFGMSDDFPVEQMMIRCNEGKGRNLYFTSAHIKHLVQQNEEKIKFINHGLRVLNKSPSKYCPCDYRLAQEGIQFFYPYMSKRIVRAARSDIVSLLLGEAPFIRQLSENLQLQLNDLETQGSILYVYDPEDPENIGDTTPKCKITITGWKGLTSARTFLPKHDRAHYLRLLGVEFSGEVTPLERASKDKGGDTTENVDDSMLSQEDGGNVESQTNTSQSSCPEGEALEENTPGT